MAFLQDLSISGSFFVGTSSAELKTTDPGRLFWCDNENKMYYSYYSGSWPSSFFSQSAGFVDISSWTAGPQAINQRRPVGGGTQNAYIVHGGYDATTAVGSLDTEEYNGSSWSTGGNMNYCRYNNSGTGTQNAALAAGGYKGPPGGIRSESEEYNGTSWAYGGNLPASSRDMAMAGTQNAAVTAGSRFTNSYCTCTFEYNGTSWSSGGALPSARVAGGAGGTQNEAITYGGYLNSPTAYYYNTSLTYDGSSWSSGPNIINARGWSRGDGTQNATLAVGGGSPSGALTCTELYDGTSWSSYCSLIISMNQGAGTKQGTSTDAMVSHGIDESCNNTQYLSSTPTETFTTSSCIYESNLYGGTCVFTCQLVPYVAAVPGACAYSSITNISTGRAWGGGAGATGDATVVWGGYVTPGTNCVQCTEEWNGSSWSAGGATIYRMYHQQIADGTADAAMYLGGYSAPAYRNWMEDYNGSSWATGPGSPSTQTRGAGAGTTNSFVAAGGYPGSSWNGIAQTYNGSSWASITSLPYTQAIGTGAGTSTDDAAVFGGYPGSSWSPGFCGHNIWNGSSWSAGACLNNGRGYAAGGGTTNSSFIGHSSVPASWPSFNYIWTEQYDGTSWSTGPNGPQNKYGAMSTSKSSTDNVGAGGYPGSYPTTSGTYRWCLTTATPQQGGSGISTCAYTNESNLTTGRYDGMGAGESKNSAVVSAGYVTPGTNCVTCTEEWDGTSWSAGGANIYAVYATRGAGTQNAASQVGGYITPSYRNYHLQYDGSTWASSTAYPSNIGYMANLGTQSDLLLTGGYGPARRTDVTLYNGTSWSSETALPVANHVHNAAGASSNAAITAGGNQNAYGNCAHYDYNGSSWSTGPNMPAGVGYGVSGGTADCAIAGHSNLSSAWPSFTRCHQSWNGTTWSAGPSYDTNKYGAMGNSRSGTSTIGAGGYPGSYPATAVAQSFEDCYDAPVYTCEYMNSFFTSSAASWSTNNAINNARAYHAGAGETWDTSLIFGGDYPAGTCTETFDGTTWSTAGALSTAQYRQAGTGTQNAALSIFGWDGSVVAETNEWNGSTWSAGGSGITGRYRIDAAGSQNAAITVAGWPASSNLNNTEEYNGTSWASGGNYGTSTNSVGIAGTQNSAQSIGGEGYSTTSCTYDGSSWSSATSLPSGTGYGVGLGTTDGFLYVGGQCTPSGASGQTQFCWNGSSWSAIDNMITGMTLTGAGGNGSGATIGGGWRSPAATPVGCVACSESYIPTITNHIKLAYISGSGA